MATDSPSSCPSCGARVSPEAERCDLCGATLHAASDDRTETEATPSPGDVPSETDAPDATDAETSEGATDEQASSEASESSAQGVFCNQCGWKNPPGARFCSRCGEKLQDGVSDDPAPRAPSASPPPGTRPVAAELPASGEADADAASTPPDTDDATNDGDAADEEQHAMAQRITLLVGASVLVVIALFFVTLWSQSQSWGGGDGTSGPSGASTQQTSPGGAATPGPSTAPGAPAAENAATTSADLQALAERTSGSVPQSLADRADSLQTVLDGATGDAAQRARRQLVNLYVGGGQPGRAALYQREIAESTGDIEEWRRTGDLFYGWMQQLQQQQQRRAAFQVAQQSAQAYERVVAEQPDNLNVRTRMGEAYLLTNNPMRGIELINGVLADDSTFVPARFQKGLALLQINRLDDAVAEFERVKEFAGEGEPYYRQAERAIQVIEEQGSGGGNG